MRIERIEIQIPGKTGQAHIDAPPGELTILYDRDDGLISAFRTGVELILCGPEVDVAEDATIARQFGGSLSIRAESGQRQTVERWHNPEDDRAGDVLSDGAGEHVPSSLMSHIPAELYRAVFSLKVEDLIPVDQPPPRSGGERTRSTLLDFEPFPHVWACLRHCGERSDSFDRRLPGDMSRTGAPRAMDDDVELHEQRDQLKGTLAAVESAIARFEPQTQDRFTFEREQVPSLSAAEQAAVLRREIDELRESWARLEASRRMHAAHRNVQDSPGIPRKPWFLAALALGVSFPIVIGAVFGEPVVLALGVVSATLGAITLMLDRISRSRYEVAQLQAQIQLELMLHEAETRFNHAAEITKFESEHIDQALNRLERTLNELLLAAEASLTNAFQDPAVPALRPREIERSVLVERRDSLQAAVAELEEQIMRVEEAPRWPDKLIAELGMGVLDEPASNRQPPAYLQFASDALDAMTHGALHQIAYSQHGPLSALGGDDQRIPLADLSPGDRVLAQFALRLGLIHTLRSYFGPLPVLVDDILSCFEPGSTVEALRALECLSTEHQVILFTSDPSTVALVHAAHHDAEADGRDEQVALTTAPSLMEGD